MFADRLLRKWSVSCKSCLSSRVVCHRKVSVIERKHGLSTEQFPVPAYIGCSKNLKDLKMWCLIKALHAPLDRRHAVAGVWRRS